MSDEAYFGGISAILAEQEDEARARNGLPPRGPAPEKTRRQELSEAIEYYIPPELRGWIAAADYINPVSDIGRAMQASETVFDPTKTRGERISAGIAGLTDMASVLAPAAALAKIGAPAARGLIESLSLATMPADELATEAVERFARTEAGSLGHNGGPSLFDELPPSTPKRELNEHGMYSPSLEAAKDLPQESGTVEQMRAMLLKGGAKAEELHWNGFDTWAKSLPKGTKVTKAEVIQRLRQNKDVYAPDARYVDDGFTGNVPINNIFEDYHQLGRAVRKKLENKAHAEYMEFKDRTLTEMGYPRVDTDPEEVKKYVEFLATTRTNDRYTQDQIRPLIRMLDEYDETVEKSTDWNAGLGEGGLPMPDPGYWRAHFSGKIQSLLNRHEDLARTFERYRVNPDGGYILTDDASAMNDVSRLADESGEITDSSRRAVDEILNRGTQEDISEILGGSYRVENEDDIRYADHFIPGGKNYSENVYRANRELGTFEALEGASGVRSNSKHWSNRADWDINASDEMFHTRSADFSVGNDGVTHHVGEFQFDQAQDMRREPDLYYDSATRGMPEGRLPDFEDPELLALADEYVTIRRRHADLNSKISGVMARKQSLQRSIGASLPIDMPTTQRWAAYRADPQWVALNNETNTLLFEEAELGKRMDDILADTPLGDVERAVTFTENSGLAAVGDVFERMANRDFSFVPKLVAETGAEGRRVAPPLASSTQRWVDAALKNELMRAVKDGKDFLTTGTAEQNLEAVGGDPEGMAKFYNDMVVKRLQKLAKMVGGKVEQVQIDSMDPNVDRSWTVPGIRITPEMRKELLEKGLPTFLVGGVAAGSSLDGIDVFDEETMQ